jgi:hypothetical protein
MKTRWLSSLCGGHACVLFVTFSRVVMCNPLLKCRVFLAKHSPTELE